MESAQVACAAQMGNKENRSIVLLCTIFLTVLAQDISITELPQGLLQWSIDKVIKVKEWKVVITVEDMSTQWDEVMWIMTALFEVNTSQMDPWCKGHMCLLQHRISHLSHFHSWHRWGLVDGVGIVAHILFSLGTDEEVDDLNMKIGENRKWQLEVSSWSEDYVVVLK